jgi:hypothetical protein
MLGVISENMEDGFAWRDKSSYNEPSISSLLALIEIFVGKKILFNVASGSSLLVIRKIIYGFTSREGEGIKSKIKDVHIMLLGFVQLFYASIR